MREFGTLKALGWKSRRIVGHAAPLDAEPLDAEPLDTEPLDTDLLDTGAPGLQPSDLPTADSLSFPDSWG